MESALLKPGDADSVGSRYALLLADTVRIGKETGILVTEGTKKAHEVILDEDNVSAPAI